TSGCALPRLRFATSGCALPRLRFATSGCALPRLRFAARSTIGRRRLTIGRASPRAPFPTPPKGVRLGLPELLRTRTTKISRTKYRRDEHHGLARRIAERAAPIAIAYEFQISW